MKSIGLTATALSVIALSATAAAARDQIRIVGSSTVFPYTQAVAEEFANQTGAPAPIVESTGTGGGMQIFCEGIGEDTADLTGASRAMKKSEFDLCVENGVTDISEAMIGYDGLSLAVSRENETDWNLTLGQVFLALAAEVPQDGEMVANPYTKWSEIDESLPDTEIVVLGPPPTSGTRDAFVELAMHAGCESLEEVTAIAEESGNEDWVDENCSRMRTDGPFIEAGENDNLIVQRLNSDPNALGIFGYSFLYENQDTLKDVKLNDVQAEMDTIASGEYPLSRPLFFYVKNAHRGVIPNLQEFVDEYMSENALAPGGYLEERGLVALGDDERAKLQEAVTTGSVKLEVTE
ncbi:MULTISPECIES: substrate-binding domain-containing protein [Paracoccus]|uniref:Phosphate ABC transporter substrate-binding protein n=2 Tax=Paracoccus TaxID=265 RepID=A0A418T1Z8_9RHOB|nr:MULTISPECIES: substrate-binding domain-containing protein [Paracoccus]RJE87232.1 phosphate ABC transporter substrate-binding protein [Paracoccus onubensis]WCR04820.1 substrate-binding domain-containing protein [Paracoccus saliphilus]SIT12975.1 phosphate ABC transporter substrate-binding protein, PhoT family [Paracoccus saliphilus]